MEELAHTKRLRDKIVGLKAQLEQTLATMHALAGAIQFADEELAEQEKESQHADGEQTVSQ